MNRLTEAAQNMIPPQGIKGRQILKLLLNHLQTGVEDDQTFKIAELSNLKCRQTCNSDDEARLRSYLSTWDNLIYGIKRKIDDGVLLAVFIENVRHLRCMRPDIERWDRDETVRSFPWLYKACQDCVERWQKRQNTLQMYQTFHEQRSRSGSHSRERDRHPGAPGVVRRYHPLARKSDPSQLGLKGWKAKVIFAREEQSEGQRIFWERQSEGQAYPISQIGEEPGLLINAPSLVATATADACASAEQAGLGGAVLLPGSNCMVPSLHRAGCGQGGFSVGWCLHAITYCSMGVAGSDWPSLVCHTDFASQPWPHYSCFGL